MKLYADPVIKAKILIFSKVSGPKKNTIISIFFLEFCQPSTLNFDPWVEIWTSMGRNLDFHGYCREFPQTSMGRNLPSSLENNANRAINTSLRR